MASGDLGGLESALTQPKVTFGGTDLHVTLVDKAARNTLWVKGQR
jgi:hypothetical protein